MIPKKSASNLVVRVALGASSKRIAGELLMESVLLGLLEGLAGLGLAYGALRVLAAIAPAYLPRLEEHRDRPPAVLLFTLGISLGAGVLFGADSGIQVRYRRAWRRRRRGGGRTLSQNRAASRAEHPGDSADGSGGGSVDQFRVDDSHVPGAAERVQPGFTDPGRPADAAGVPFPKRR